MRGRSGGGVSNNNTQNRKGPNPLTRNYESNGPDVKIRGSAQQIAEKYAQLARDSHSSGDRVMAENYLQHAEHYNRIIAAAQAQMPIQNVQNTGRDNSDDDMDDDRDEFENQGNAGQGYPAQGNANQNNGNADQSQPSDFGADRSQQADRPQQMNLDETPQPTIDGTPAEVALNPEASGEGSSRQERRPNGFNGGEGEGGARRGRRPRRGERARPELNDDAGSDETGGLAQTLARGAAPERSVPERNAPERNAPERSAPEPVAEESGDAGPTLIDVDN